MLTSPDPPHQPGAGAAISCPTVGGLSLKLSPWPCWLFARQPPHGSDRCRRQAIDQSPCSRYRGTMGPADTWAPQLSTTSPGSCRLHGGDVIPGFWLYSSSLSLSCMCRLAAHVLLCSSVGHWVWGPLSISLLPCRSLADPGAPWGSHLVPQSPHGAGQWGGQHAWHRGGWWHSLPWSRSQHNPAGPSSSAGCPAPGGDGSTHGRDSGGCHWGAG